MTYDDFGWYITIYLHFFFSFVWSYGHHKSQVLSFHKYDIWLLLVARMTADLFTKPRTIEISFSWHFIEDSLQNTAMPRQVRFQLLCFASTPVSTIYISVRPSFSYPFFKKSRLQYKLNHQRIAEIIKEVGLPGRTTLPSGVKEGSYWHTVSTRYLGGEAPRLKFVKAVCNLWRYQSFREPVEVRSFSSVIF